jgi:hypothetical protein
VRFDNDWREVETVEARALGLGDVVALSGARAGSETGAWPLWRVGVGVAVDRLLTRAVRTCRWAARGGQEEPGMRACRLGAPRTDWWLVRSGRSEWAWHLALVAP